MTNIWTQIYKEIREPFFEIEDPYTVNEEKKEGKEKEEKGEKKHKEGAKEEKSEDAGEDQEHKYKKTGKKSKDYDGDGEVEDEADEYAGVKDRAIKKAMRKEDRDIKNDKSDRNEKLDVRKNISNKVDTKPSIPEEVEEWVDELIQEGYDLSDFTWEEVIDIYESSSTLPPRGDAETIKPDPLQSAKRRAAQAQVRKELSDLQVAKARASAKLVPASEEAVLSYLENRYDLSEGVFDPKKTKLRSSEERRKTELSPAQKKAAEMKQKRSERLEQEAEKVLRQVRGGSSTRRSSKPMGSETPSPKTAAPESNRKLSSRQKQDTLAQKAGDVLKSLKNK